MKTLLRVFFRLLYHQFAFTYDLVAATVSFNRWKDWIVSVIPFIEGSRILEIGHGPGHLQRVLLSRGLTAVGIDESTEMGRLAIRTISRRNAASDNIGYTKMCLTRGVAQHLPFPNESFETVIATFPTEYISDPQTLSEIKRCLSKSGRLVVLPVSMPKNPFLDWLFKVTHQSPIEALDIVRAKLKEPFIAAGFQTEIQTLDVRSGILLIVLARKPSDQQKTQSPET